MRDLALLAVIAILIPFILRQPWLGVLVGAWISLMNPHRYAFGFANDFPFALIVALATVAAMVFGKHKIEFPRHAITFMIIMLMFWFTVTTAVRARAGRRVRPVDQRDEGVPARPAVGASSSARGRRSTPSSGSSCCRSASSASRAGCSRSPPGACTRSMGRPAAAMFPTTMPSASRSSWSCR